MMLNCALSAFMKPRDLFLGLYFFIFLVGQSSAAIRDGLTAYWTFDQTLADQAGLFSGTDNSVSNNLVFRGTGSTFGPGRFGSGGYQGNGNGYAETADSADVDENNNQISVSAWVRVNSLDTSWQAILSKGEQSNYRLHRFSDTDTVAWAGGSSDIADSAISINDGQWHHIVGTSHPSRGVTLYLNGVEIASNSSGANLGNSSNPLMIGTNPDRLARRWDGEIDDVAIWNRELSSTEVSMIFNNNASLQSILDDNPNGDDDGDGLPNQWEIANQLVHSGAFGASGENGASGDPDSDNLTNLEEYNASTDPRDWDSDDDTLSDGDEINIHGTNPNSKDSDGDGLWDAAEIAAPATDPNDADSDGDNFDDGLEISLGFNPNDPNSSPPAGSTLTGLSSSGVVGAFLDGDLPAEAPGTNWQVENAFVNLSFEDLKGVVSEPRSTFIHVIERRGTLQRVDTSDRSTASKAQVLDIRGQIVNGDNGGLRSVVFHPDYNLSGSPNRNYIYLFYSTTAQAGLGFSNANGNFFYRLSRFTRNESTGNFESELVLIQQRSRDRGQHFGGGLAFDGDGFLNISWGDMEFSSSRVGVPFYQDVQRIDRIFQGAVLRIDVDQQGGAISQAPTRTLQGNTGPNAMAGTSQSCPTSHPYYHADNFSGVSYFIPSDNYFLNNPPAAGSSSFSGTPTHGPALDEHQALGTRNPWRMAVDPVDGTIAMFNVGSNAGNKFEEVDILTPGANFGWPYLEGTSSETSETGRSLPPSQYAPTYLGTETDPAAFWTHSDGGRIAVGGLFYRGSQWSALDKQLIFADHSTGKIWALDYKDAGTPSSARTTNDGVSVPDNYSVRELIDSSLAIRQMTAGPSGEEIYIAAGGRIHRLFEAIQAVQEPPALLSDTGAFTDLANLTPRAGLIPYTPASTLWSDRSAKFRWIAIPNDQGVAGEYDTIDEKIIYSENSEWQYPIGTVFIKHFALPTDLRDPDNPALLQPVETRFLVRGQDGNYFYFTYQWRADGSDADLLTTGSTSVHSIIDESGTTISQTWEYPTRGQCVECHQEGAGHVLGMKTRQLNHGQFYPSTGTTANQLTTFDSLALFDIGLDLSTLPTVLSSAAIEADQVSVEHRVRSYLDSNCSYCHRPESNAGRAVFDARLTMPLALSGMLNGEPRAGNLGIADAKIIKPGSPEKSIIFLRDSSTDTEVRMPPIARSLNDPHYVPRLRDWIERLGFSGFDSWATAGGVNGGLTDDDDGDQVANVIEFTLGLNGQDGHLDGLPRIMEPASGNPQITIPITGAALSDGLTLVVEGSTDLINWYPAGNPSSGLEVMSDTSSPGVDGARTIQFIGGVKTFVRYGVQTP